MRKVAILTGGRAEYGLLRPLLFEFCQHKTIDFGLLVTGMHLSREFGNTISEIEQDPFPIWEKIDCLLAGDSPAAICKSIALAIIGISDVLHRYQPDILVLLGDRYELLAAAQAAMIHNIPIAHIHGGEATEGLIDEAIRHAVTKMSHLHFTSTETYRNRVIQMGEDPARVFNTGALGLDNINSCQVLPKKELEKSIGIKLVKPVFLITYHPVTLSDTRPSESVEKLLDALEKFEDASFVFTYPNSDTYGREIVESINNFILHRNDRAVLVSSLGVQKYLSIMKISDAVIGNSSSGIIEAPSMGVPTVNIGSRQRGRVRANSVLTCEEDTDQILNAIKQSQTNDFREKAKTCNNPYGSGNAAKRVAKEIVSQDLNNILMKTFIDAKVAW